MYLCHYDNDNYDVINEHEYDDAINEHADKKYTFVCSNSVSPIP